MRIERVLATGGKPYNGSEEIANLSFAGAWNLHLLPVFRNRAPRNMNVLAPQQLRNLVIRVRFRFGFAFDELSYLELDLHDGELLAIGTLYTDGEELP